jgi:hypothetical protein
MALVHIDGDDLVVVTEGLDLVVQVDDPGATVALVENSLRRKRTGAPPLRPSSTPCAGSQDAEANPAIGTARGVTAAPGYRRATTDHQHDEPCVPSSPAPSIRPRRDTSTWHAEPRSCSTKSSCAS